MPHLTRVGCKSLADACCLHDLACDFDRLFPWLFSTKTKSAGIKRRMEVASNQLEATLKRVDCASWVFGSPEEDSTLEAKRVPYKQRRMGIDDAWPQEVSVFWQTTIQPSRKQVLGQEQRRPVDFEPQATKCKKAHD